MSKKRDKAQALGLTDKQKLFCEHYVVEMNATEAYRLAYNSSYDTAKVNGCNLLTNANIQDYIGYLQQDIEKALGLSKIKVVREHQKIAFSNIGRLRNTWIQLKEFNELSDEEKACIQSIDTKTTKRVDKDSKEIIEEDWVKIKLYDKQKSLDSISKMLGYDAPTKIEIESNEKKDFALFMESIKKVDDGFNEGIPREISEE